MTRRHRLYVTYKFRDIQHGGMSQKEALAALLANGLDVVPSRTRVDGFDCVRVYGGTRAQAKARRLLYGKNI